LGEGYCKASGASRRGIAELRLEHRFHETGLRSSRAPTAPALPPRIFPINPLPTSRVELTLDANLLPSKVASPENGEMRPIRQQTGQRRKLSSALPGMAGT
jgi:hypothetical protein